MSQSCACQLAGTAPSAAYPPSLATPHGCAPPLQVRAERGRRQAVLVLRQDVASFIRVTRCCSRHGQSSSPPEQPAYPRAGKNPCSTRRSCWAETGELLAPQPHERRQAQPRAVGDERLVGPHQEYRVASLFAGRRSVLFVARLLKPYYCVLYRVRLLLLLGPTDAVCAWQCRVWNLLHVKPEQCERTPRGYHHLCHVRCLW